jgi:acetyltransferase-like isoleucine patch superfamily enzyme
MKILSKAITKAFGRTYRVKMDDLPYIWGKGMKPALRGLLWCLLRVRRWNGLLLGPNITMISARNWKIGKGVSIGGGSYLDFSSEEPIIFEDGVTIRENSWLQSRSGLNTKATSLHISQKTYIGPNAVIGLGGKVTIGQNVQIGAGLNIIAESHNADDSGLYTTGEVNRRGVSIGNNCWLGNNVTLLDGVEIGDGCVIGAGAIVTRPIPSFSLALGVPAKVVRSIKTALPDIAVG